MCVDLEKAYVSVQRNFLKMANINENVIKILKEIYYKNSCEFKLEIIYLQNLSSLEKTF